MTPRNLHLNDVFVVIPAFNEEDRIVEVIRQLTLLGFENIVIVDDGGSDRTSEVIPKDKGIYLLRHVINLGPGASTMTGIEFSLLKGAKYIGTIDADHQHDPEDLLSLINEIDSKNADLLIGSRFLKRNNKIPLSRLIYNYVGNMVSYYKTGSIVSDSQSGLKVMTRRFAEKLYIDYNGFEFSIDIIRKARLNRIKIAESPVGVRYTKDTLAKGQNFQNGITMLWRLLNPFR